MDTTKNYNLYVIAADTKLNNELIKFRLKRHVTKDVKVHTFNTRELCIEKIKHSVVKPDVVVLYHRMNTKPPNDVDALHTMDAIKKMCPESSVIIVSEVEDMHNAVKALRHGAQDCIIKDRFLFHNIGASVNKCLHPSKM